MTDTQQSRVAIRGPCSRAFRRRRPGSRSIAMFFSRRRLLLSAVGLVAAPFLIETAKAENYPARPIRFVVPFPAGGVSDIIARQVGQWLSERLGQPLVVEDRGGAGRELGPEVVGGSPPER